MEVMVTVLAITTAGNGPHMWKVPKDTSAELVIDYLIYVKNWRSQRERQP
jgi:hypothetical protein